MTPTPADLARRIEHANDVGEAAELAESALAQPGLISEWLSPMLAQLAGDPHYRPPLAVRRTGAGFRILLLEHRAVTISATVIARCTSQPAATSVTLTGGMHVTAYHHAAGAMLQQWRSIGDHLVRGERLALGDFTVRRCDGRSEAQLLVPAANGHGERDMVLVTAAIHAGADPLVREYDAETGRLIRTATSEGDASRRQMLLAALRVTGDARAGAAFDKASRHPAFFLRWEAMREWLGHDATGALPRLQEMARHDPEPAIRAAAGAMAAKVRAQVERAPCPA